MSVVERSGRFRVAANGLVLFSLVLVTLVVEGGCKRQPPGGFGGGPPPQVSVVTVQPITVPVKYEFIGQTEASRRVEIRARVQGFLISRSFEEGGQVTEGDLLFQIDPRPFEADLEVARARLAQAEVGLAKAHREAVRFSQMVAEKAASQKELDDAQTEELDARAMLRTAAANVTIAELDLSYTTIHSPLTGRIGRAQKEEGALVDDGQNSLLAVVIRTDPIYVSFSISERDVLAWQKDVESGRIREVEGETPRIRLILLDGTPYEFEGRINFFDTQVDANTGSTRIRAEFPNPSIRLYPNAGFTERLMPGQFVRSQVLGWERINAIVVPQRAVMQGPTGATVLVVGEEDIVEPRQVTLGQWNDFGWVVESGLRAGERVVTAGLQRVMPGMKVTPEAQDGDSAAGSTPPETNSEVAR